MLVAFACLYIHFLVVLWNVVRGIASDSVELNFIGSVWSYGVNLEVLPGLPAE